MARRENRLVRCELIEARLFQEYPPQLHVVFVARRLLAGCRRIAAADPIAAPVCRARPLDGVEVAELDAASI